VFALSLSFSSAVGFILYALSLKHHQTKTWQREIAMATNGSIARYKNDNKHKTRSMRGTSSSITNVSFLPFTWILLLVKY
jgi:hypothetical protein